MKEMKGDDTMRKWYLKNSGFFIILALFTAMMVPAAGSTAEAQGDKDIMLSGGFFHSQGSETGTATLDLAFGYYTSECFEIGIRQTLNYIFIDDEDDVWSASTHPFINYYFTGMSKDTFRPFIGAFAGAVYNEDDATGSIGPAAGFKSFMGENAYLLCQYRYEWYFNDLEVADVTDTSDGNHVVTLGIGFQWQ